MSAGGSATLHGADACSVFCGTPDPDLVVGALRQHLDVAAVDDDWERVVATGPAGRVVVNRLMYVGPGGRFSGIVLGSSTAVRSGRELRDGGREQVLSLIGACDMVLGVRLDPVTGAGDARADAVLAVALATGGVVLVGDAVLDAAGRALVEVRVR